MFCGQCGTEIAEKDGFCTNCGSKVATKKVAAKKEQQTEQSVNNWHGIYQSVEKFSKEKQEKKILAKEEKEKQEKKIIAKEKIQEKKRLVKEEKEKERLAKKEKEEKPEKYVATPVLPQSNTFSFSGSKLPTFLIAGFVLGFITFAIIGSSSSSDPYGCTQCDVFAPGYDGPPPIEMDLWVPDDYYYDGYYYDDYYDGGYYP